jgi:hypothetical protein
MPGLVPGMATLQSAAPFASEMATIKPAIAQLP